MKRIAIITLTKGGTMNFGNRLQNYALQRALETHGARAETIWSVDLVRGSVFLARCKRAVKKIIKTSSRRIYFDEFNKKHIHLSPRIRYGENMDDVFDRLYDAFVVGSDQVWNPLWCHYSFDFAGFAEARKRFSYAASFGVSEVPEPYRQRMAESLQGMRAISVREDDGLKIVRELAGREALVHIDPTLLLNADHYATIEKKPTFPLPENYMLCFFLGNFEEEFRAFAQQVAQEKNLTIVELNKLPESPTYSAGPQHFLYLFRHARYICTDSFHGTAFSILFQKQFTVFRRKGLHQEMSSRIETILGKLGLSQRLFDAQPTHDPHSPIDYQAVEPLLEQERESANQYLRQIAHES